MVSPALCQLLSVGVKAGVPFTDDLSPKLYPFTFGTRRYLVGGTAELHLPFRFSVEVDAIYRRIGFDYAFQSLDIGRFSERTTANQWEFPLLVKYEVLGGPFRPFIDAGPALRHISGITDVYNYVTFPFFSDFIGSGTVTTNNSPLLRNRNSPGIVVGGGVTLKLFRIRLSPEIRYTHWGNEAFQGRGRQDGMISSTSNQADVILGITF